MAVKGIDVSNHQGMINWNEVFRDDVKFAFIKASESTNFRDKFFTRNWTECKRIGITRGAYHFARPSDGNTPEQEAYFFLDGILDIEEGDILILDMEDERLTTGVDYSGWYKFWLEIVTNIVGFKPLVYTGKWYLDRNVQSRQGFEQYNLWLSAYQSTKPKPPTPWTGYEFWQYTDEGRVRGVSGNCDVNQFSGLVTDLSAYGKPKIIPPKPELDLEGIMESLTKMEMISESMLVDLNMMNEEIKRIKDAID